MALAREGRGVTAERLAGSDRELLGLLGSKFERVITSLKLSHKIPLVVGEALDGIGFEIVSGTVGVKAGIAEVLVENAPENAAETVVATRSADFAPFRMAVEHLDVATVPVSVSV